MFRFLIAGAIAAGPTRSRVRTCLFSYQCTFLFTGVSVQGGTFFNHCVYLLWQSSERVSAFTTKKRLMRRHCCQAKD